MVVFNSTTQELKDLLVMVEADEEENTELQAADLRSPLRDSDVEILLASFGKGNRHITSLNLSNNYLTARGAMAVMRFVQNSPQVTALRLNNNGIEGGEGVARGLKMLLLGSETIQVCRSAPAHWRHHPNSRGQGMWTLSSLKAQTSAPQGCKGRDRRGGPEVVR